MSKRPLMALVPAAALILIPGLAVTGAHGDTYVQPEIKATAVTSTYSAAGEPLTVNVAVMPLSAGWTPDGLEVTCDGKAATQGPEVTGTLWSGTYSFEAPDAESVAFTCQVDGMALHGGGLSENIRSTSDVVTFSKKAEQASLALADATKTEFSGAEDFKGLLTVANHVDDKLGGLTVSFGDGVTPVDVGEIPPLGTALVDLPQVLVAEALEDGTISFTAQLMQNGSEPVGKPVAHTMTKKVDPQAPAKSNVTVTLTAVDRAGNATSPMFAMRNQTVTVAAEVCGTGQVAVKAIASVGGGPEQAGTVDPVNCLKVSHAHRVTAEEFGAQKLTIGAWAYEEDKTRQPVEASIEFTWTEAVRVGSGGADMSKPPAAGDRIEVPISLGNATGMSLGAQISGDRFTFEDGQHESGTLPVSAEGNDAAATAEIELTADEASAMVAVIPVTVSVWESTEGTRAGVRAAIEGVDPAAVTTYETVLEVPLNVVSPTPTATPAATAAAKSGTSSVPKTGARVYGIATLAAVALMLGAEMIHRSNRRAGRID